ncbi:calpastatin [Hymenobacter lapidarius]|uniref:Calpastatin n=2 Tax=Hymenobacter lapidarius TaxID=1908237 RepID=A0A1G1TF53_9BACT|nr:calpastatin [Hymenobacter lapidarius]
MGTTNNMQRFVDAQASSYQTALSEIKNGKKRSHWMWYIFPQIQGLGLSETARFYALADVREAAAYLAHPVLGSRLLEISRALLRLESADARHILGSPDDLKLKSSMTLFALVGTDPVFQQVLNKFYQGSPDDKTLRIVAAQ